MAQIVPNRWQRVPLPSLATARPVTATWAQTLSDQLAFLHGRIKHVISSTWSPAKAVGDVKFTYLPSPGARVVLLTITFHEGTGSADLITCSATIAGASELGGTTSLLDGSTALPVPVLVSGTITRIPSRFEKLFDVSALTVGTPVLVTITTAASTGTPKGVATINLYEIPRDMFDGESSPSTDEGISAAWPFQGNEIYAGSATTTADAATGTERIVRQLDRARSLYRPHIVNLCTRESTGANGSWQHTTAAATYTAFKFGQTNAPRFYFPVRRLYSTSTRANYEATIRYNTNGFSPTFRIITPDATNNDITLTNSAGAWASVTGAVTVETNTTGQIAYVDIQINPNTGGAVTTYISHVAIYCKET